MLAKVGVMQGRLSPMINNRIQQFPWDSWPSEFVLASKIDIKIIEWTIDTIEFYKNPLINQPDQINLIMDKNDISIPSVTCEII
jgi:hexulose-6-phosphate isomerase